MAKKFNVVCAECLRGFHADNARQDCVIRLVTPTTKKETKGPICEKCEEVVVNALARRRASVGKRNIRKQERLDKRIEALQAERAALAKVDTTPAAKPEPKAKGEGKQ